MTDLKKTSNLSNTRSDQILGGFPTEGTLQSGNLNKAQDSLALPASSDGGWRASKRGGISDTKRNFPASRRRGAEQFFQRTS